MMKHVSGYDEYLNSQTGQRSPRAPR